MKRIKWFSVNTNPPAAGNYYVRYDGERSDKAPKDYSIRYWDGKHWMVLGADGKVVGSAVFGSRRGVNCQEFWSNLKES